MGHYRRIDTGIHNDEHFRLLPERSKFLWFCLYTDPALTGFGAMKKGLGAIAEERGWKQGTAEKYFMRLVDDGFIIWDASALCLWFPKFYKRNLPENPNQATNLVKMIDLVPECNLRTHALWAIYSHIKSDKTQQAFMEGLPEQLRQLFAERLGKQLPKPNGKGFGNSESESESDIKNTSSNEEVGKARAALKYSPEEAQRREFQEEVVNILATYPNICQWSDALSEKKQLPFMFKMAGKINKIIGRCVVTQKYLLQVFTLKDGKLLADILKDSKDEGHFYSRLETIWNKVKEFGYVGELESAAFKWDDNLADTSGYDAVLSRVGRTVK
jgi:hypothetical protein